MKITIETSECDASIIANVAAESITHERMVSWIGDALSLNDPANSRTATCDGPKSVETKAVSCRSKPIDERMGIIRLSNAEKANVVSEKLPS